MEEEVFEPVVSQAFRKWKENFSWKWFGFWTGVLGLLGLVYWQLNISEWRFVVVSAMSVVIMMGVRLPWLVEEMMSVSSKNLGNKSISKSKSMQNRLRNTHIASNIRLRTLFCRNTVIWLLWMVGVVAMKRVGWVAKNIDNGTALFLLYLPAVWLFKIPRAVNGFLALAIIPFLPFFLAFGMERTAEIWAVVLYFLLVTATVQMIKEVRDEKNN